MLKLFNATNAFLLNAVGYGLWGKVYLAETVELSETAVNSSIYIFNIPPIKHYKIHT